MHKAMRKEAPHLPQEIIHSILSHLNPTQRARASALSKAWLSAWQTNPNLQFDFRDFFFGYRGHWDGGERELRNHIRSVLANYQQFCPHDDMQSFSLNISDISCYPGKFDIWLPFLNQQLQIPVKKGVKVVRLEASWSQRIFLPEIILKAKSLTELSIQGFRFQNRGSSSLMCNNLLSLELKCVHIDDGTLSSFIRGCPLISDLNIVNCRGLKTIKVTDVPNLRHLLIDSHSDRSINIEIDAQNVETIDFRYLKATSLVLHPCKALRRLSTFMLSLIPDTFFDELMEKFPRLEYLKVQSCEWLHRIKFTSQSLKHVCMYLSPTPPFKTEIDAPNMVCFESDPQTISGRLSARGSSGDVQVTIHDIPTPSTLDERWFSKLNILLSHLHPSKVSLHLSRCWIKEEFDNDLGKTLYPNHAAKAVVVDKVDLHAEFVSDETTMLRACFLLRGLFLACRPKILVMHSNESGDWNGVAGAFCDYLEANTRKLEGLKLLPEAFWQKDLEKVQYVVYDNTGKESWQQPLLPFLPPPRNPSRIVFKLQWNANSRSNRIQETGAQVN